MKISILTLLLFLSLKLFPQENIKIFDSSNSIIPENEQLVCIENDKNGNIWIGSRLGGLYYFNGKSWLNFNKDNSILYSNYISKFKFFDNHLLVNCSEYNEKEKTTKNFGLFRYTFTNEQLVDRIPYPPFEAMLHFDIDRKNNIWISKGRDIEYFNGEKWTTLKIVLFDLDYTAGVSSFTFKDNDVYAINYNGLFKYNFEEWQKIYIPQKLCTECFINKVVFDSEDNLWLATSHGLLKKVKNEWITIDLSRLESEYIRDIEFDNKGNIWLLYLQGIVKLNSNGKIDKIYNSKKKTFFYNPKGMKIINNTIWVLYDSYLIKIS